MATERLYYPDPNLLTFTATILDCKPVDTVWHTVLDKTAFYPTSGGQLFDTGCINDVPVTDVSEADDGSIIHISSRPCGQAGDVVSGKIDTDRRRMHRQQHTAQHILSSVFAELFSFETVSVHLGEEYGAVELNTEAMQSEQLWQAEKRTREIIAENAEVSILFISASEAAKLPLRKPPAREGTIRIIKIGEYDWSACGGTHCIRTSEIGSFVVLGTSKMRGRTLVTYLAGDQLTADYESRRDVTAKLGELFTCSVADLPSNVAKLVDESKFQRKQIDMLFREVIPMRAESKAGEARQVGAYNLYVGSDETEDAKLVSLLAGAIAERISGIAVMMGKSRVIIACGRASCCKAGDIAKAVASATGGRGGGSDTAAQVGSIPSGTIAEVASIVETYLAQH